MLIAFCGIDGSGKSTHAEFLSNWLLEKQIKAQKHKPINSDNAFLSQLHTVCTKFSELNKKPMPREHRSILLAFELFQQSEIVKKWIAEDITVVVDRWIFSHYAYAYARNIETQTLKACLEACIKPDLVFLLDVPVHLSLERIDERNEGRSMNETKDILTRAREKFLEMKDDHHFILLDTTRPQAEIEKRIQAEVSKKLNIQMKS
ncbi:dTMP kinase [Paenibacillus tritici]|uniref:Thymidylate kinase n=1 Tax=Paenibacillus tritici TaxID=1873425 RepID=A0ABX2DQK1_9BACL|nr:dTMP kinase [Paenibacillus tritici]NQX46961.1 dTMP kinase [Paenibacillus tritici]